MTELSVETAEFLQIARYGIGGHYGPHWDFSRVIWHLILFKSQILNSKILKPDENQGGVHDNFLDGKGNRIATLLFYVRFGFQFEFWQIFISIHFNFQLHVPERGGATAFPVLKIAVNASKVNLKCI